MTRNQELAALSRKIEIGPAGPDGGQNVAFPLAALDHLDDVAIRERLPPTLRQTGRRPGRRLGRLLAVCKRARHGNRKNQIFKVAAHGRSVPRAVGISELAGEGQRKKF
jgi:hypothetical protein